jgi:iron complex outermembrane receptor protein
VGHITQDYRQLSSGSDFAAFNILSEAFGLSATPADTGLRTATEDFQTYLADVRYHISPNDMVYFRFATGFRPGGPNDTIPGLPATFQPDTTKDYEVGWKTNFWDNKGYLDISLYNIDWDSIQVQATVNGLSGEINGGTAVSRGVEASVALRPLDGLNVNLSGAYNDAHLTENAPGGVGNDGDPMPGAPKWSGAAGATYEWELGDGWRPFVGGQVRYVDSRHTYFEHAVSIADYVLPAYTLVDLQAGVRRGPYEVTAFARNLSNERAQQGAFNVGVPFVSIERPRTIGMSFSAHW